MNSTTVLAAIERAEKFYGNTAGLELKADMVAAIDNAEGAFWATLGETMGAHRIPGDVMPDEQQTWETQIADMAARLIIGNLPQTGTTR